MVSHARAIIPSNYVCKVLGQKKGSNLSYHLFQ